MASLAANPDSFASVLATLERKGYLAPSDDDADVWEDPPSPVGPVASYTRSDSLSSSSQDSFYTIYDEPLSETSDEQPATPREWPRDRGLDDKPVIESEAAENEYAIGDREQGMPKEEDEEEEEKKEEGGKTPAVEMIPRYDRQTAPRISEESTVPMSLPTAVDGTAIALPRPADEPRITPPPPADDSTIALTTISADTATTLHLPLQPPSPVLEEADDLITEEELQQLERSVTPRMQPRSKDLSKIFGQDPKHTYPPPFKPEDRLPARKKSIDEPARESHISDLRRRLAWRPTAASSAQMRADKLDFAKLVLGEDTALADKVFGEEEEKDESDGHSFENEDNDGDPARAPRLSSRPTTPNTVPPAALTDPWSTVEARRSPEESTLTNHSSPESRRRPAWRSTAVSELEKADDERDLADLLLGDLARKTGNGAVPRSPECARRAGPPPIPPRAASAHIGVREGPEKRVVPGMQASPRGLGHHRPPPLALSARAPLAPHPLHSPAGSADHPDFRTFSSIAPASPVKRLAAYHHPARQASISSVSSDGLLSSDESLDGDSEGDGEDESGSPPSDAQSDTDTATACGSLRTPGREEAGHSVLAPAPAIQTAAAVVAPGARAVIAAQRTRSHTTASGLSSVSSITGTSTTTSAASIISTHDLSAPPLAMSLDDSEASFSPRSPSLDSTAPPPISLVRTDRSPASPGRRALGIGSIGSLRQSFFRKASSSGSGSNKAGGAPGGALGHPTASKGSLRKRPGSRGSIWGSGSSGSSGGRPASGHATSRPGSSSAEGADPPASIRYDDVQAAQMPFTSPYAAGAFPRVRAQNSSGVPIGIEVLREYELIEALNQSSGVTRRERSEGREAWVLGGLLGQGNAWSVHREGGGSEGKSRQGTVGDGTRREGPPKPEHDGYGGRPAEPRARDKATKGALDASAGAPAPPSAPACDATSAAGAAVANTPSPRLPIAEAFDVSHLDWDWRFDPEAPETWGGKRLSIVEERAGEA